jgi:TRAP-type C4-dicarboxylate transport system permease small subunit
MDYVGKLYGGLINLLAVLAALMIVFAIGLVIVNVGARAMGYGSFHVTIAAVEYILLYFTMFSAPYLLHTRGHVLVDMVVKNLTGLPRRLLESVIYLIGIAVCAIFAVVSVEIMRDAIARSYFDERSIDVPYWLLYANFPLCFGLLTIEFCRYLVTSRSLYEANVERESL